MLTLIPSLTLARTPTRTDTNMNPNHKLNLIHNPHPNINPKPNPDLDSWIGTSVEKTFRDQEQSPGSVEEWAIKPSVAHAVFAYGSERQQRRRTSC